MTFKWIATAAALVAGLGFVAADPALARVKQKPQPRCVERPATFSWGGFWSNPAPGPNGCAPAVFVGQKYIGQDPDPNIRFQLARDPRTGATPDF